jgi:hypothetical protein
MGARKRYHLLKEQPIGKELRWAAMPYLGELPMTDADLVNPVSDYR